MIRHAALIVFFAARAIAAESTWQSDWKTAFQSAREKHRLVFVDYFATWCKPCREMDERVFPLPAVQERLADFVLLRIDVDKNNIANVQHVSGFPTYVFYDPGERERFRIVGELSPEIFNRAVDDIRSVSQKFLNASALFDQKKDVDAELLTGNTYSGLGMFDQARDAYARASKSARRRGQQDWAQLAEALGAFTFAREGKTDRAIKLLKDLVAKPASDDAAALVWLTLGNAYRVAKNPAAALDAYRRARALAKPGSTAYEEATAAIDSSSR